ncbi:MAG: hypothetical protein R3D63_13270 [Paracoccaceae bacterium]
MRKTPHKASCGIWFAAIFTAGAAFAQDINALCPDNRSSFNFESVSTADQGFTRMQTQNGGEIGLATDPVAPQNHAAHLAAGGKLGQRVGKSDLIYAFSPARRVRC